MRKLDILIGAAALTVLAAPALAQSTDGQTTISQPTQSPTNGTAAPGNVRGTPACPSDMACTDDRSGTQTTSTNAGSDQISSGPSRMYASSGTDSNVQVVTNGPVPDTAANRRRFGGPRSHAGRHTAPAGN